MSSLWSNGINSPVAFLNSRSGDLQQQLEAAQNVQSCVRQQCKSNNEPPQDPFGCKYVTAERQGQWWSSSLTRIIHIITR